MLISEKQIIKLLETYNIKVNGALHIGAHECEELPFYNNIGINKENIIWIDGNTIKVTECLQRGIPNVYYSVITDKDDDEVEFNITNNGQSSSVLPFGSHAHHHPHVHFVEKQRHKTITIDTFFEKNQLDMSKYDFWNFDIQGAELMALRGAKKAIAFPKAIYLEVNSEEVYKGCGLINEIDSYLANHKFKRVLTHMTEWGWGDALYLKSSS